MIKITIDTNCLIDVEENRPNCQYIKDLIKLVDNNRVQLFIPAIIASDLKLDGSRIKDFILFKKKIRDLGFVNVKFLKPVGYYDLTYMDWCLWSSDEFKNLETKIWNILFSDTPFDYSEYQKKYKSLVDGDVDPKWRNKKCDELILWSHINYGGDVFVSSDLNFHKRTKKELLENLGASKIILPKDILNEINQVHD